MKALRIIRIAAFALAFAALSSSIALAQGFYWESMNSGGPSGEHVSKTYMMPRIFKIEQGSGKLSAMIVDLDKKLVITINNTDKTYSETTFDEMEARMKQLGEESEAKMAELKEKMKTMPEEQRKMMEKMMGPMAGGGTGAIEVKKTGEKKAILGYSCTEANVMQGDTKILTVWVTKSVKGFDKLRADWEEFSQRMAAQMPGKFGKTIAEGMKKIDGFPMETDMGDIVSKVTKLEARSIPASTFAVPEGYKKVSEPMFRKKEK
jgi:hypothetical protein